MGALPVWARRTATTMGLLPVWLLLQAGVALADGTGGQTPGALGWIKLTDRAGVSVWNYELSLDRGGVTAPGKIVWSFVIDMFWQLYRGGVVIAIWFIDWALSFTWLPAVVTPVLRLAGSLTAVMHRLGGAPTLLTITAFVAVGWMIRGKWALGIYELMLSLVIASVATGALPAPVTAVAGPHGLVMNSRSLGLEVADGLASDGGQLGGSDAEALGKATTERLVETFVRLPLEVINFGAVVDGGKCEGPYNEVLKGGPYGSGDDIRNAVADCDSALGDIAANPGSGQAVSAVILSPAAALVVGFATVLAGTVFLAAIGALYQGLRLIVTLVTGLLPGAARGSLWITIADLIMAAVMLVFAIVFLAGYLLLITSAFTSRGPGESPMQTFFFVDVLLVVALVVFWRGKAALKRASGRLAQVLASRPGGGARPQPARQPFDAAGAYYRMKMASGAVSGAAGAAKALAGPAGKVGAAWTGGRDRAYGAARGGAIGVGVDLRAAGSWMRWATGGTGAGAGGGGRSVRPHRGAGPALPPSPPRALPFGGGDEPQPSPTGGGPRSPGGAPARLAAVLGARGRASGRGRLVRQAGKFALAAATGGTSAVTSSATSAAVTAVGPGAVGRTPGRAGNSVVSLRKPAGPDQPSRPGCDVAGGPGLPGQGAAGRHPAGRPTPSAPRPGVTRLGPGATRGRPPVAAPTGAVGSVRVIDQDGRALPDAPLRLQERLDARPRRPAAPPPRG